MADFAPRVRGALLDRLNETLGLVATMARAGMIAPLRPGKYLRIAVAMRRENVSAVSGFAAAAQRCPDRAGLVDELGTLTWREIDQRCDAFAAALQALPGGQPRVIGIMCRNHRGFIETVVAANRIGTGLLLLNTSFAGPALAEVVTREGADAVVYDEEFTEIVGRALADRPGATHIVAWTDAPSAHRESLTVEQMIGTPAGHEPKRATEKPRPILLTSGTTGTPKGAELTGGDPSALKAILDRSPWHTEEAIVVAAPMFHAWGFSQLIFAATMACTIVTRRKFDPEATLELVDRHGTTGLAVVPVMFDRIMELPEGVRNRYSGRSLRFAAASGSRMRPDVVTAFMDQFGDVIYNNYNATEAGATLFGGYTSGKTKDFHDGFMASGDMGYVDGNGRLFVVGRDDEMIVSGGENGRQRRLPHRCGEDSGLPRGRRRSSGDRGGRRTVRSAVGGVRRSERRRGRHARHLEAACARKPGELQSAATGYGARRAPAQHHRQDRQKRPRRTGRQWLSAGPCSEPPWS